MSSKATLTYSRFALFLNGCIMVILGAAVFSVYYRVPGYRYWPRHPLASATLDWAALAVIPIALVGFALALRIRSLPNWIIGAVNIALAVAWVFRMLTLLTYL